MSSPRLPRGKIRAWPEPVTPSSPIPIGASASSAVAATWSTREDKSRCYDCAGIIVPARFFAQTGKRIDPPPPVRATILSSYAGRSYGDGVTSPMPGSGIFRTPLNQGLSGGFGDSR